MTGRVANAARTRSATSAASSAVVLGSMRANSSPPRRAATSAARDAWRRESASACSTRSPASWPCASFTDLKWSTSKDTSATGSALRAACAITIAANDSKPRRLASSVSGSVAASAPRRSFAACSSRVRVATSSSSWPESCAKRRRLDSMRSIRALNASRRASNSVPSTARRVAGCMSIGRAAPGATATAACVSSASGSRTRRRANQRKMNHIASALINASATRSAMERWIRGSTAAPLAANSASPTTVEPPACSKRIGKRCVTHASPGVAAGAVGLRRSTNRRLDAGSWMRTSSITGTSIAPRASASSWVTSMSQSARASARRKTCSWPASSWRTWSLALMNTSATRTIVSTTAKTMYTPKARTNRRSTTWWRPAKTCCCAPSSAGSGRDAILPFQLAVFGRAQRLADRVPDALGERRLARHEAFREHQVVGHAAQRRLQLHQLAHLVGVAGDHLPGHVLELGIGLEPPGEHLAQAARQVVLLLDAHAPLLQPPRHRVATGGAHRAVHRELLPVPREARALARIEVVGLREDAARRVRPAVLHGIRGEALALGDPGPVEDAVHLVGLEQVHRARPRHAHELEAHAHARLDQAQQLDGETRALRVDDRALAEVARRVRLGLVGQAHDMP